MVVSYPAGGVADPPRDQRLTDGLISLARVKKGTPGLPLLAEDCWRRTVGGGSLVAGGRVCPKRAYPLQEPTS